jgi:hypothetical protein
VRRFWQGYGGIVLLVTVVISCALTWTITLHSAERAVQAERQARLDSDAARREQALASLAVVCNMITKQEAVFRESESEVGRNAADAWHDLGVTYRCYAK